MSDQSGDSNNLRFVTRGRIKAVFSAICILLLLILALLILGVSLRDPVTLSFIIILSGAFIPIFTKSQHPEEYGLEFTPTGVSWWSGKVNALKEQSVSYQDLREVWLSESSESSPDICLTKKTGERIRIDSPSVSDKDLVPIKQYLDKNTQLNVLCEMQAAEIPVEPPAQSDGLWYEKRRRGTPIGAIWLISLIAFIVAAVTFHIFLSVFLLFIVSVSWEMRKAMRQQRLGLALNESGIRWWLANKRRTLLYKSVSYGEISQVIVTGRDGKYAISLRLHDGEEIMIPDDICPSMREHASAIVTYLRETSSVAIDEKISI